jgi:hypothetical protein
MIVVNLSVFTKPFMIKISKYVLIDLANSADQDQMAWG